MICCTAWRSGCRTSMSAVSLPPSRGVSAPWLTTACWRDPGFYPRPLYQGCRLSHLQLLRSPAGRRGNVRRWWCSMSRIMRKKKSPPPLPSPPRRPKKRVGERVVTRVFGDDGCLPSRGGGSHIDERIWGPWVHRSSTAFVHCSSTAYSFLFVYLSYATSASWTSFLLMRFTFV